MRFYRYGTVFAFQRHVQKRIGDFRITGIEGGNDRHGCPENGVVIASLNGQVDAVLMKQKADMERIVCVIDSNEELIGILEDELPWYYTNKINASSDPAIASHIKEITRDIPKR